MYEKCTEWVANLGYLNAVEDEARWGEALDWQSPYSVWTSWWTHDQAVQTSSYDPQLFFVEASSWKTPGHEALGAHEIQGTYCCNKKITCTMEQQTALKFSWYIYIHALINDTAHRHCLAGAAKYELKQHILLLFQNLTKHILT